MTAWLESIAGPEYANALVWTIFALVGLLALLVIIRVVRGLTFGTFVAGGKNRKARLAVMDATAVDSQRRLVLVRRDDIEHLILIGGPTDVVVEQNIRLLPPARRAMPDETAAAPALAQSGIAGAPAQAPAPVPASVAAPVEIQPRVPPAPRPAQPAPKVSPAYQPATRPASVTQPAPQVTPPHAPHVAPEPRYSSIATQPSSPPVAASVEVAPPVQTPRPVAAASSTQASHASAYPTRTTQANQTPHSPQPESRPNLDEELLQELQVTLDADDNTPAPIGRQDRERSLDEEMSRLLGELSVQKP